MQSNGILKKYPIIGQFLRFGVIGVFNTGVDLIILNILMLTFSIFTGPFYAVFKAISFSAAATFSYFMNKKWAFKDKSKKQEAKKFSQFFTISIVGAVVNVTAAFLVVTYLQPLIGAAELGMITLNPALWGTIGGLFGTASGLVWNFLGYKFIVFKK